jgi:hypothetical protein
VISFTTAQELQRAGSAPNTNGNAVYFLNDHLKMRREDALRMWYGSKTKAGLELDLSKEVVYFSNTRRTRRGVRSAIYFVVR